MNKGNSSHILKKNPFQTFLVENYLITLEAKQTQSFYDAREGRITNVFQIWYPVSPNRNAVMEGRPQVPVLHQGRSEVP